MLLHNICAEAQRETLSLEPCSPPLIPAKGTQAMSLIHLEAASNLGKGLEAHAWGGTPGEVAIHQSPGGGGNSEISMQTLPRIRAGLPRGHALRSITLEKADRGARSWPFILILPPACWT